MKKLIIILLFTLTGCAMTPTELRNEGQTYTFEVIDTYQSVYRTIKSKAMDCWSNTSLFSKYAFSVNGELYTDIHKGNIYFGLPDHPDATTNVILDISTITNDKTRVVAYTAATYSEVPIIIEQWFNGSISCYTEQDN